MENGFLSFSHPYSVKFLEKNFRNKHSSSVTNKITFCHTNQFLVINNYVLSYSKIQEKEGKKKFLFIPFHTKLLLYAILFWVTFESKERLHKLNQVVPQSSKRELAITNDKFSTSIRSQLRFVDWTRTSHSFE